MTESISDWDGRTFHFPKKVSVEMTFNDVDFSLFALLTGSTILELLDTPQNRDTWRRNTLTKADQ